MIPEHKYHHEFFPLLTVGHWSEVSNATKVQNETLRCWSLLTGGRYSDVFNN
jgi:hypothetical protein